MTKKKIIILAVVVIALIVGLTGLYFFGQTPKEEETSEEQNQEQTQEEKSSREEEFPRESKKLPPHFLDELAKRGALIKITSEGFDFKEVNIESGESLSFANLDDKPHKIFSDKFLQYGKEIKIATAISIPIKEKVNWQFWLEAYPEIKLKVMAK